jgi:hypothetical protein
VWSFCRFLHLDATKGELNFLSERSEVVNSWIIFYPITGVEILEKSIKYPPLLIDVGDILWIAIYIGKFKPRLAVDGDRFHRSVQIDRSRSIYKELE